VGAGDPCMANSEGSQANFVASVYLVGVLYKFMSETLLLPMVEPLIGYLAAESTFSLPGIPL